MWHKALLALPLLSLAPTAFATPLEAREAAPGLIDDLLGGLLTGLLADIKAILSGVKSGIADNDISSKPFLCLPSVDKCCVCEYFSFLT